MNSKDKIIKAIEEALAKLNVSQKIILTESKGFGDFSTNVAMLLQKQMQKSALEVAELVAKNIDKEKYSIKKVEVAKPGFINFFLETNIYSEEINKINQLGQNYGKLQQNQKINLEFVSVNPTGFLHLGHARGAAVGATLANILSFAGNQVTKEYYINDAGNQIDLLGISVFTRYQQHFGLSMQLPEGSYIGDDIKWVAHVLVKLYGDKYKDADYNDPKIKEFFKYTSVSILMGQIKRDLKLFGITFDKFFSERSLYKENKIEKALSRLQNTFKRDNALWLKTTDYGDDKDRVLIKQDGSFTYFLPDIAYHNEKMQQGVDKMIDVWGADHIGYIKRMEIAIDQLGYDSKTQFKVLTCQIVRLMKDGEELKMSKRKGITFTARELIELVGKDAARFFMVDRSENSMLDFDVKLAIEQTQKNPVFMIQYAYARAKQLLTKADSLNKKLNAKLISEETEIKLTNTLREFPELIEKISKNYKIHLLSEYLIKLAKDFNSFYSNSRVIQNEREESLLALVQATKTVLETGLKLIGVSTPERM
ncbi:arginine--tRNA ligase [Mycoplasma procyoni]|uniref:arginine--tRNA ligase n=1 Tax=Mycoplasma procyoni TaxID=568784 RepID=UPI00197B209E|nr:arginine--tRNA ligase [Mycoplasma procyoni]MBN3534929.1 arginine--tRNA ligase [Mycoplasma procyoni]